MSFTTGTTMANPYVLNIVDLQNVAGSATGISVQDAVTNLTEMVDYATKTVAADNLTAFTPGGAINVTSPLNITTTEASFSNADGTAYNMVVYGAVSASNFNSLCPMIFKVHNPAGIEVETMRITETGNVGIGTFAPAEKLVVDGTIRSTGNLIVGGSVVIDGDVVIKGNLRVEGTIQGRF